MCHGLNAQCDKLHCGLSQASLLHFTCSEHFWASVSAWKCNGVQFKMAKLKPPPRPVSPLPHFTDPHVRLQSLGPGLSNNTSLPQRNKPPMCSCVRDNNIKSTVSNRSITGAIWCFRSKYYLGRHRCIGCLSSS